MKKALVLCALACFAVYATTAWSASGPTPVEKRLEKDVATLKAQVKTLQKGQKTLTTNLNTLGDAAISAILVGICSDELAADAFQGTWQVIDQLSAAQTESPGKTYFGPQTPVTATLQGQDICAAGGITRSQVVPPTVAPYLALLAPFHSNASLRSLLQRRIELRLHLK